MKVQMIAVLDSDETGKLFQQAVFILRTTPMRSTLQITIIGSIERSFLMVIRNQKSKSYLLLVPKNVPAC